MKYRLIFLTAILFLYILNEISAQKNESRLLTGKWEILECNGTPVARHENCFIEVNDKFYLLAGRRIREVSIFDPKTNKWTSGAKPPYEIHHFQGVSYNGKIYVIGAMTGAYPNEKPLSHIMTYDPAKDIWEKGDEIPENRRRGSAGLVIIDGIGIVICGIVDGHNGTHVNWVDSYNFESGKWAKLADAPRTRDHFAAAVKNGKIYCAGGRNTSTATGQTFELTIGEVDVYDIASNSWESLPTSQNIPTQRAGSSSVILGDDLIVIGGESGTQLLAHKEVEAYNIKTKTWRKLDALVRGRHGTQAILYRNSIFIAAGSGNRGGKPELDTIEKFELVQSSK